MAAAGWGGLIGAIAVCVATWGTAAQAAPDLGGPKRSPGATGSGPVVPAGSSAVADGHRSIGADELARAARAMDAAPSTTIWRSRLPDGTIELGDRPPAGGAVSMERRSYPQVAAPEAARRQADAERDYWRRQAEAFEQRRTERERAAARAQRERPGEPQVVVIDGRPRAGVAAPDWAWTVVDPSLPGLPPSALGPSVYSSSPGAVQGRSTGGFIGSGFSTAR